MSADQLVKFSQDSRQTNHRTISRSTYPRQHRHKDLSIIQRDILLIEIKYCEDTRPQNQLSAVQEQHKVRQICILLLLIVLAGLLKSRMRSMDCKVVQCSNRIVALRLGNPRSCKCKSSSPKRQGVQTSHNYTDLVGDARCLISAVGYTDRSGTSVMLSRLQYVLK